MLVMQAAQVAKPTDPQSFIFLAAAQFQSLLQDVVCINVSAGS